MTIEITIAELEALIDQRLKTGTFRDAEDVILQALKSSASEQQKTGEQQRIGRVADTGAALIEAMQASPYKELVFEPTRERSPVRDVVF